MRWIDEGLLDKIFGYNPTFNDYLKEHDPYAEIDEVDITEDVKAIIKLWFGNREIKDDFEDYFKFYLITSWSRYLQLLRIEPGFARYDWLVQRYTTLQRYAENEKEESERSQGISTKHGTQNDTNTGNEKINDSSSDYSTSQRDIGEDEKGRDFSTNTSGATERNKSTRTPDLTETNTSLAGTTTSYTGKNTTVTNVEGEAGSRAVSKSNPQSMSYPNFSQNPDGGRPDMVGWHVPQMDWKYPSKQAQDRSRSESETTTEETPRVETTVKGDGGAVTTRSQGTEATNGESETISSGTGQTENESERNLQEKGIYAGGRNGRTEREESQEHAKSTEETGTTSGSIGREASGKRNEKVLESGRNKEIARLLKEAKNYIQTTSAIKWLLNELEPAFWGVL